MIILSQHVKLFQHGNIFTATHVEKTESASQILVLYLETLLVALFVKFRIHLIDGQVDVFSKAPSIS